jgi:transposase, IS30 family
MAVSYQRLSFTEREDLSRGLAAHRSLRSIALDFGRSPSTLSREVHRAHMDQASYRAEAGARSAHRYARYRRHGKTKLSKSRTLWTYVEERLHLRWSPEQIAKRMRLEYPLDETMRISHEAIYSHIYIMPKGLFRHRLIKDLRRKHKRRRHRALTKDRGGRGRINDMQLIDERPSEVEGRLVPGHWEGDLVVGKRHFSAIGTLVERQTRYAVLVPLKDKHPETVRSAFAKALSTIPQHLKKTLTYDQGKEMSAHKPFTAETNIQVYFAHPNSPWERGTNENTNGLIRQFFPKGIDFNQVSEAELAEVQKMLNGRPRETLGWATPEEALTKLLR